MLKQDKPGLGLYCISRSPYKAKVIKTCITYGEHVNAPAAETEFLLVTGQEATLYIRDEVFIGTSLSDPGEQAHSSTLT